MKRLGYRLLGFNLLLALFSGCNLMGTGSSSSAQFATSATPMNGAVQLSWTAATGVVQGYYIEQSTNGSSFTQVQATGNVTSATVTGLASAKIYYFRIRAYNAGGNSAYSSVASTTTN